MEREKTLSTDVLGISSELKILKAYTKQNNVALNIPILATAFPLQLACNQIKNLFKFVRNFSI